MSASSRNGRLAPGIGLTARWASLSAGLLALLGVTVWSCAAPHPAGPLAGEGSGAEAWEREDLSRPATGPFTGTWAQLQVLSEEYSVPVLGSSLVRTIALLRLDIRHWDEAAVIHSEVCQVEIDNRDASVDTTVPPALLASLEPFEAQGTFRPSGDAFEFHQAPVVLVRGATLSDPARDALPTEPDDPRVVDMDHDGHPGFSIFLDIGLASGLVYMVQRQRLELTGTAVDLDHIDGTITFRNEQYVLGADSLLLAFDPERSLEPGAGNQIFRTTRVDDDMDCAAIVESWPVLFGRQ